MGEHFLFTMLMALLLLGAFTVISLVMLWAPSAPFPMREESQEPVKQASEEAD